MHPLSQLAVSRLSRFRRRVLGMGIVVAATLGAATPAKTTIACAGLSYVGMEPTKGDAFLDYFSDQLSQTGELEVVTRSQISQLLGLERQRQLLGCEGSSCIAELSGALGASLVLTGSIARVGQGYAVSFKLVAAASGATVVSSSDRLESEEKVYDWLQTTAKRFGDAVS